MNIRLRKDLKAAFVIDLIESGGGEFGDRRNRVAWCPRYRKNWREIGRGKNKR